ncbi:general stress protein [Fictibacillus sp. NRS-1165]|uniref:general stress protein n=1 Tax=Fictibacillus sp. NRS-1165 TaxID=3144463 RepID=UPI003D1B9AF1
MDIKPIVREYDSSGHLVNDVRELQSRGVDKNSIYIWTHQNNNVNRLATEAEVKTIGRGQLGINGMFQLFDSNPGQLVSKLKEVGLSTTEAERYEKKLEEGKGLIICTDNERTDGW